METGTHIPPSVQESRQLIEPLIARFKHFLDSGEQALIVITLLNDIEPRAGGTYVAEDGLSAVCKWCVSTISSRCELDEFM